MAFLFGHKAQPQYVGLATQTSSSDIPITICAGKNRVAPNIIWQGDFQKHAGGAGKGLGGTQYTYSGSFQLGLCWGPIDSVSACWNNGTWQGTDDDGTWVGNYYPFTAFLGTSPQAPWGWLTSSHPDQALGYPYIAHMDVANFNLGSSNTLNQYAFEVKGLLYNTAPWAQPSGGSTTNDGTGSTIPIYAWTAGGDADMALFIDLYINSPLFGIVGGPQNEVTLDNLLSTSAATTAGDSAFQTWCQAVGFGISPVITAQESGTDAIQRWMDMANSAIVWTGYSFKIIPYSSDTISGNGVTYVPDVPVVYSLGINDYLIDGDNPPVKMDRIDPADAYNSQTITIDNRENSYNPLPVEWRDQGLVNQYGLKAGSGIQGSEVANPQVAAIMITLYGQRIAYTRNSYVFKVPVCFSRIEPMDILEITDREFGTFLCRITDIEEQDDDSYQVTANEYTPSSTSVGTVFTQPSITGNNQNTAIPASPVNPPLIWEPPSSVTGNSPAVWCAVSGGDGTTFDPNWGGYHAWLSTDGTTYEDLGEQFLIARMGKLTAGLADYTGANPDTTNTMSVSVLESGATLSSAASGSDAAAGVTQLYCDGEYLSYETATLSGSYTYDLTGLYRGQDSIPATAHASGVLFARLDENIFKYTLPAAYIGKTLYLKFQSMNLYGMGLQDITTCTVYTVTPSGAAFGTGTGGAPSIVTGVSLTAGSTHVLVNWTANSPNDNVAAYSIYRADGTGASFSSSTKVGSSTTDTYTDSSVSPTTAYTYFVVAANVIGPGAASAGSSITTGSAGSGVTTWSVTATGTGASQNITLPYSDLTVTDIFVFGDGLRYKSTEYSISGATLTMTTNAAGDTIEIVGITT